MIHFDLVCSTSWCHCEPRRCKAFRRSCRSQRLPPLFTLARQTWSAGRKSKKEQKLQMEKQIETSWNIDWINLSETLRNIDLKWEGLAVLESVLTDASIAVFKHWWPCLSWWTQQLWGWSRDIVTEIHRVRLTINVVWRVYQRTTSYGTPMISYGRMLFPSVSHVTLESSPSPVWNVGWACWACWASELANNPHP